MLHALRGAHAALQAQLHACRNRGGGDSDDDAAKTAQYRQTVVWMPKNMWQVLSCTQAEAKAFSDVLNDEA
jgi:hypothetical protein